MYVSYTDHAEYSTELFKTFSSSLPKIWANLMKKIVIKLIDIDKFKYVSQTTTACMFYFLESL